MIKKSSLLLAIICLFGIFSLNAQRNKVKSFMYVNASMAYAGQTRASSHYDFKPYLGTNDNLGIGYQLYVNHFTFGIGAEFGGTIMMNYSNEGIHIDNKFIPKGMLELLGNIHFNTPVMLGAEFGKFYFKVGVVPSMNLLNGATVLGPVLSQENPSYYEHPQPRRFKNPFQLYGRFEIGGSFGKFIPLDYPIQPKARFYLGGYVDFGFTNDTPAEARGVYDAQTTPYAISNEAFHDVLHQISVGLRFTCLLNFAK